MYETFYNLTGKPFQLNPDPTFYFASKGHSRAYAYLKYGLFQGEGFIVITGEIGAGKTTLLRAMMEELDRTTVVPAQLVSTQLDADDLLKAVAASFGLPINDKGKAELLSDLQNFLTGVVNDKKRALLIVDEAQNLTPRAMEELRMLSNFQLGDRALLQSFLVGQPELREIMRGPSLQQLRQRIIASYHLGPMDKDETRAYVLHRLERVGWKNDPTLDDSIFEPLYEATGGVPRKINAVCNRLLLGTYLSEKHAIGIGDLEGTLSEMRDEIGPESAHYVPAVSPDLPRGALQPSSGADVVRMPMSAALTQRLDRLDKNVATALELLRAIAMGPGAKQPIAPPAPSPDRRPRFGGRTPRSN
jgi:general secretion pathway protein A